MYYYKFKRLDLNLTYKMLKLTFFIIYYLYIKYYLLYLIIYYGDLIVGVRVSVLCNLHMWSTFFALFVMSYEIKANSLRIKREGLQHLERSQKEQQAKVET